MYRIDESSRFKLSYKVCRIKYGPDITALDNVVMILAKGHKLNKKYRDHQLTGRLSAYRECHIIEISEDWLLIYRIYKKVLYLVDTGSHSDLFGN